MTTPVPSQATIPPLVPQRSIDGISAVLMPIRGEGAPDWDIFRTLVTATWAAGLTPAVNMDTGYVGLLSPEQRTQVLRETHALAQGRRFVAGAFIDGDTGDPTHLYGRAVDAIRHAGGTPILFQCRALAQASEDAVLAVYAEVARSGGPLLAFELGTMFAPFGRIYSTDFFRRLMNIEAFVGAKHSSLDRACEWARLRIRDAERPEFRVYTGNDLAIDMVFYGSDYLLGLSAFCVDAFGVRDRLWAAGDPRAVMLNDLLQYLGHFAFRPPVPAYRHTAAQFLHVRGVLPTSLTHPGSPTRPSGDVAILADISARLDTFLDEVRT